MSKVTKTFAFKAKPITDFGIEKKRPVTTTFLQQNHQNVANYFAQNSLTVILESRTLVSAMKQQKPLAKKPVFGEPKKVTIPQKKERKKKKYELRRKSLMEPRSFQNQSLLKTSRYLGTNQNSPSFL